MWNNSFPVFGNTIEESYESLLAEIARFDKEWISKHCNRSIPSVLKREKKLRTICKNRDIKPIQIDAITELFTVCLPFTRDVLISFFFFFLKSEV